MRAAPMARSDSTAAPTWVDVIGSMIAAPGTSDGLATVADRYGSSASMRNAAPLTRSQPPAPVAENPRDTRSFEVNVAGGVAVGRYDAGTSLSWLRRDTYAAYSTEVRPAAARRAST